MEDPTTTTTTANVECIMMHPYVATWPVDFARAREYARAGF